MEIGLCLCCDTCLVDGRTNSISFISLIDEVSSLSFPIALARLTVVTIATRSPSDENIIPASCRLKLGETQVASFNFAFEFQDKPRTRSIGELFGVPITGPGNLRVSIHDATNNEIAFWNIAIIQVGPPQMNLFTAPTGAPSPTAGGAVGPTAAISG
jgi:hypothetical protein